jgi:hypothetical protein
MKKTAKEPGDAFENEVIDFLAKSVGPALWIHKPEGKLLGDKIQGASGLWEVDIIIEKPLKFIEDEPATTTGDVRSGTVEHDPFPRAVIECKWAGPIAPEKKQKGSSLNSNLARAYEHLNDIHLKNKETKLFVVVSRLPIRGEQSRDYRLLFRNIGVGFFNFGDSADRQRLVEEVSSLIPSGN